MDMEWTTPQFFDLPPLCLTHPLILIFFQEDSIPPLMCKWGSNYAELQDFEPLEDAIFYAEVFNPEVVPKMFFSTESESVSTSKTKILFSHL